MIVISFLYIFSNELSECMSIQTQQNDIGRSVKQYINVITVDSIQVLTYSETIHPIEVYLIKINIP